MTDFTAVLPLVLARLFPDPVGRADAERILSEYGTDDLHRERERVRVAILRVAGSDLVALREQTALACDDYRDALVSAEYPRQAGRWPMQATDPARYQALVELDAQDFEAWIAAMTSG